MLPFDLRMERAGGGRRCHDRLVSDECAEMRRLSTWAADDLQGAGGGVVTDASTAAAAGAYLQRQMVRFPAPLERFPQAMELCEVQAMSRKVVPGSRHRSLKCQEIPHLNGPNTCPSQVPREVGEDAYIGFEHR